MRRLQERLYLRTSRCKASLEDRPEIQIHHYPSIIETDCDSGPGPSKTRSSLKGDQAAALSRSQRQQNPPNRRQFLDRGQPSQHPQQAPNPHTRKTSQTRQQRQPHRGRNRPPPHPLDLSSSSSSSTLFPFPPLPSTQPRSQPRLPGQPHLPRVPQLQQPPPPSSSSSSSAPTPPPKSKARGKTPPSYTQPLEELTGDGTRQRGTTFHMPLTIQPRVAIQNGSGNIRTRSDDNSSGSGGSGDECKGDDRGKGSGERR